jgi:hypothetical protein
MMGGGPNKNNIHMNKQPVMNNNMIMNKMTPNGPLMARGIRNQQMNSISPNMGAQRPQVLKSSGGYGYFLSLELYSLIIITNS